MVTTYFSPSHRCVVRTYEDAACIRQARYEDAEPLLLEAYHGREAKLGPEHPHTIDSLNQFVSLYEAWDKPDEAEKWRTRLPRTDVAEE